MSKHDNEGKHKGQKHQDQAAAISGVETMTISPATISPGDTYPSVTINGFEIDTTVQVKFPGGHTSGFMVNQQPQTNPGPADVPCTLDAGIYVVESEVYDLAIPTRPVFDHYGPTATLTVA